jgi:hypothetical protein
LITPKVLHLDELGAVLIAIATRRRILGRDGNGAAESVAVREIQRLASVAANYSVHSKRPFRAA